MAADPFSIEQMHAVATIADELSFSRAAAILGITQPAVSQLVRGVEATLGRTLFERGSRGVTLTADGEAYLVYARAMMKIGEDARRHFRKSSIEGVIRLGLNEDFARTIFPSALAVFLRQHPNYAFEAECDLSTPLFAGLDEGRYAAVIAKRPARRRSGEKLWDEPMRWSGRAETPMPVADPVDLVLMPAPSESRSTILEALQRASRAWRVVFQSRSVGALEAAVLAGVGLSASGQHLHGPGVTLLGRECGLPALPSVEIVMERAAQKSTAGCRPEELDAFCRLMREMAVLSAGVESEGSEDEGSKDEELKGGGAS